MGITPYKALKPLRRKCLQGVEELGIEIIMMSRVIMRTADSDLDLIEKLKVNSRDTGQYEAAIFLSMANGTLIGM